MLRVTVGTAIHADACEGIDHALGTLGATGEHAMTHAMPGLLYLSPALAAQAPIALAHARERLPQVEWYGAVTPGVIGISTQLDEGEPALGIALIPVPAGHWRMLRKHERAIGGTRSALVHASPDMPELATRIEDQSRHFDSTSGGLVAREQGQDCALQFVANRIQADGCSGLAFTGDVHVRMRLTQGCRPLAREHVISGCDSHYIQTLDGEPALDVLLADLGVPEAVRGSTDGDEILRALPARELRRGLLVGLAEPSARSPLGFGDYAVRQLVGIDPTHRILAVAGKPSNGHRAVFCTRDLHAARADLIRICAELREEIEGESLEVIGAHYVSCVSRASLFGSCDAELDILRHNLGEIAICGFFANGELANGVVHSHSGVLTLFVR